MHYEVKPKVHIKGTSTEEGKVLVQCSNPLIIHMANFEHVAIFVKDSMARKRSEKERWTRWTLRGKLHRGMAMREGVRRLWKLVN